MRRFAQGVRIARAFWPLVAASLTLVWPACAWAARDDVRIALDDGADALCVSVSSDHPLRARVFRVGSGGDIVLEFHGRLAARASRVTIGSGGILWARYYWFSARPPMARVYIKASERLAYDLPGTGSSGSVTLTVTKSAGRPASAAVGLPAASGPRTSVEDLAPRLPDPESGTDTASGPPLTDRRDPASAQAPSRVRRRWAVSRAPYVTGEVPTALRPDAPSTDVTRVAARARRAPSVSPATGSAKAPAPITASPRPSAPMTASPKPPAPNAHVTPIVPVPGAGSSDAAAADPAGSLAVGGAPPSPKQPAQSESRAGETSDLPAYEEPTTSPADVSILPMLAGLALNLAIVLGLGYAAMWILKRYTARNGAGKAATDGQMEVLETRRVGPRSSLLIVKVGDRVLLVGSTPAGMQTLGVLDSTGSVQGAPSPSAPAGEPAAATPFAAHMKQASAQVAAPPPAIGGSDMSEALKEAIAHFRQQAKQSGPTGREDKPS